MKKMMGCLCAVILLVLCLAQAVRADQAKGLEERITELEKEMKELKNRSWKGTRFSLCGKGEIEYIDSQSDDGIDEKEPHLALLVELRPAITVTNKLHMEFEIDINQAGASLDEWFIKIVNLPLHSEIKLGLDDRFMRQGKKPETYSLAEIAFWRDDQTGIFLSTKHGAWSAHLSCAQGPEINTKQVGKDNSYPLLHDHDRTDDFNGIKEVGLGLEYKTKLGKLGEMDLLAFGYIDELSSGDIATLQANLVNYTSQDDDRYRTGLNLKYNLDDFSLLGQLIDARDGDLDRYAWYVTPAYKIELPWDWKHGKEHELAVRYGRYEIDTTKSFSQPTTWDREEITMAWITAIVKNTQFTTEYRINNEKTGNGKVHNNEFIMEFEVRF